MTLSIPKVVSISFLLALGLTGSTLAASNPPGRPFRPDYKTAPNPQLMPDEVVELDGMKWEFAVGDGPDRIPGQPRPGKFENRILFGFAPESDLSGVDYESLRDPHSSRDVVWYRKEITLPENWKGGVLTFEGIDYESEIYVDGELVQRHVGGHVPFGTDIGEAMKNGVRTSEGIKHTIMIRAEDDRLRRDIAVGKQERRVNEGVIFYGNSTGAWKGAHIRKVEEDYITFAQHQADANGRFRSKIGVKATTPGLQVEVQLVDRETGKIVGHSTAPVVNGEASIATIVKDPKLWYPDSPTLYDVRISLLDPSNGRRIRDTIRSYCGFRSFIQEKGHFFLNGSPTYLRGVLNQMVFPKGLYTPETRGTNAHDIRMIREHGFDFQRVHNTTPSWRDIYDMENGVLALDPKTGVRKRLGVGWALEMPSARDLRDPRALQEYVDQWKEIVQAYGHGHPGLFYFVPGNEDWGMLEDNDHFSPATDAEREAFQKKLYRATVEAGPQDALVSVEDGWRQITGVKDGHPVPGIDSRKLILSAHDYRGSGRELREAYGAISVAAGAGTPMPANQKNLILDGYQFAGDDTAFMIGEFGGKSYATPGSKNVFGYGHVYSDMNEWTRDSIEQLSAIGELGVVRGGYIYTQVRDAGNKPHRSPRPGEPGGELNGFLFADGRPKSDPKLWAQANEHNLELRQKYLDEFMKNRPEYKNSVNFEHIAKLIGLQRPWCLETLR